MNYSELKNLSLQELRELNSKIVELVNIKKSEIAWETKQEGYKQFRKDGGYNVTTTEKSGYKEFYILNAKKMGIVSEDDTLDVAVGASKQALKGAMRRMGNNKMSQRKILQHFVKKVA